MDTIHYTNCPVCGGASFSNKLEVTDQTVSKKSFPILECNQCGLRFTQDIPSAADIGGYYKSADYISHSNTSKGLINKLYKLVRNKTVRSKRKRVEKITGIRKGHLLDIGAGTGFFLNEMKKQGWGITGLEPDEDAVKVALAEHGLALKGLGTLFGLPAEEYDAITLWHVLEHVHDLKGYVSKFSELLKPGGKLFIAVPNCRSYDAAVYGKHWAAYDVPRHLYHFTPSSMRRLMGDHGFRVRSVLPMWFDSYYVSLLSSRYKNGKPNWAGAFVIATLSNLKALLNKEKCSSLIYVIEKDQ